MRKMLTVLAALTFTASLAPALHAQHLESIEVRVTNVDVVVTDRAGKPVHGLTRDDFELYENGKLQPLSNFYEIRGESIPSTTNDNAPQSESGPPVELRRRRVVFFIDNDTIDQFARRKFVSTLEANIDRILRPGDEGALMIWARGGLRRAAPFTTDVAVLKKALQTEMRNNNPGTLMMSLSVARSQVTSVVDMARERKMPANAAWQAALGTVQGWAQATHASQRRLIRALGTVSTTLSGLEGKKVLVFATGRLAENVGRDAFLWLEHQFRGIYPVPPITSMRESQFYPLGPELRALSAQANQDGVTMYLLDTTTDSQFSADPSTQETWTPDAEFMDKTETASALQMIAATTGGSAITHAHDFTAAFDTLARDLDSYYSLGYRAADEPRGVPRNVRVRVRREGLQVRSRRSWEPKSSAEQLRDRVVSNIFHDSVKSELPVRVTASQPMKKGRDRYVTTVTVVFPATLTLLPDGDELGGGFTVHVVIGNERSEMSNVSKSDHPIRILPAHEADFRARPITYTAELTVRGGTQTLSVSVTDRITGATGFGKTTFTAK